MRFSLYPSQDNLKPKGFEIRLRSLILSSLAINLLSLALPVMTLQVYDRILPNPLSGTLPVLIAGVCVAIVLEALLRVARGYVISWNGAAYEHRLSCQAMEHVLTSDLANLSQYGVGDQLHRMSAAGKLKEFYNGYAHITLFELIFVPLFLALVTYIAGWLVLVPVTVLGLFVVLSVRQGQQLRDALHVRETVDDERYNFLIKGLEGIHTLKSFALENTMSRKHEHLQEQSTLANYRVTGMTSEIFNTGAIFSHVMVSAVIAVGAVFVLYGHITTGGLIATILLSGRMMQPIQRGLGLWAKYQDYTLSRTKAEELMALPQQNVATPKTPDVREGTLALEGVCFRYPKEESWLIKDAKMELKRGEVVLLTGKHGSGKTAMLELMAGMYRPQRGDVLVDGQSTADFAPETLIRHVGYIQADGLIFNGTIRDNMTCFGHACRVWP